MYMTRKEIYDHIWTRTVQGFADDYSLNYPILLRRIKEAGIPRPSRKEILFIRQGEDGLRAIHRPELPGDPDEDNYITLTITSWEIDGETVETVSDFIWGAPKSLQMVTAARKSKDAYSLEGKL